MFNIKKILGLCEYKGCLCKSMYDLKIKDTEITKSICDKHIKSITMGSTFREVELEDGAKLTID